MSIPTSRTKEKAEIRIIPEKCNGCGLCVSVCKDFGLRLENKKVRLSETPVFGCIGCGHCMAVCPTGAIEIWGRELSPNDLVTLPDRDKAATFDQFRVLVQRRRSIREFKDIPVEDVAISRILDAASTAPMGLPPSDVNILVLKGKEQVHSFSRDYCIYLKGMKWLVSGWFPTLMRPFWGKANDEMFRSFIKPMVNLFTDSMKKGDNWVTYDAPLAMYFYGSPYCDPADPIVTATFAMLAAESLGLGTCMLGGIHPMIQNGRKARIFREKHGIKYAGTEGLFVIMGYPAVKYHRGIRRTFASVTVTE